MAKQPVKAAPRPTKPTGQRAIQLVPYLNRILPYWGHPGYLSGQQWRSLVKNQPISIICRDTLIQNTLSLDWAIRLREPEDTTLQKHKDVIDYYTELFEDKAEGGYENYISLILQDMLDLPFGAMCEIGRMNDQPKERIMWIEHVDAASLIPTGNPEWPVMQQVPDLPSRPVVFPSHAINRLYMTPRPEIKRKGWGMAPPEKIYLALELLYRGDRYYANLLLDTPEAGILDLMDMTEADATDWLESARELFQGIDGFKVPVLYQHEKPAQWIELTRPPTDLLYNDTTLKYAQIACAGYGIRLSDIGMAELAGEKTLAGVIRGERQSRRQGYGTVRTLVKRHFERMVPPAYMFVFEEKDEEAKTAQGRALSTYGLALGQLKRDGLLSPPEARSELVATGLLEVEIDPEEVPEPEVPMGMPGKDIFQKPGKKVPFGKLSDEDRGRVKKGDRGKVPPTQGGRGEVGLMKRIFPGRAKEEPEAKPKLAPEEVMKSMHDIVGPGIEDLLYKSGLAGIPDARISSPDQPIPRVPRITRLVKVITRAMVPKVQPIFESLEQDIVERFWLPEMQSLEFDLPSELDSLITRQSAEELREMLEEHLEADPWWRVASTWEKADILAIFRASYEYGMEDAALEIIRSLYEEGLSTTPLLSPDYTFDIVDREVLRSLEEAAADMVTNVDNGTKYFIKRITVAGVRQGLSRDRIAQAIREGESAERILRDEGYMRDVIDQINDGMIDMTEYRAKSIVNTEVKRAQIDGRLEQYRRSGLSRKAWKHFGRRGLTEAGNIHPCPVCVKNEDLGFVDVDYLFETVFKKGGPEDDGRSPGPPAHPTVCHCGLEFDEKELFEIVRKGEYAPWLGGA